MDYNIFWKVLVIGLAILITAIILNVLANLMNINTWYAFINNIRELGLFKALRSTNILSWLFLFIVYPMLLGTVGYFLAKVF